MNARTSLGLAASLLIGGLAGWLLRGSAPPDMTAERDGTSAPPSSRTTRERPRHGDRVNSGRRRTDEPTEESDYVTDLLQIEPAAILSLIDAKIPDLEQRTQLVLANEPLAALLDLDAVETEALNSSWKNLRSMLDALRLEKVRHQRLDDGGMWLGVESFPAEGDELRREFLISTLGILGESRGKVFLGAIKAHQAFGQWGKTVGTGYVIRVRTQDDGNNLYEITEQAHADGSPGRKWQAAQIPGHLEDMAKAAGIALTP